MRLVKLPAMSLKPGMFIAELDRPWLETPFALQGFVVKNPKEIVYVAKHVDHVYVDADYTGPAIDMELASLPTYTDPREHLRLNDEFQLAKVSFENASQTLDAVFDALANGEHTDIQVVKSAVDPLIESVFRNQEAVAALVRLKDCGEYRYHHGVAMAVWSAILGRHLGLNQSELEKLAVGCAMCDVGMTKLPAELLNHAGHLTDEQAAIIRAHPQMGAQLITESGNADIEVISIVENHHERADGSGYPRGIEGAKIPLLARIAGIVDSYDAMITPRPYATARTSHEAVQELIDTKQSQFQESLVEQFVQAIGLFPTGTMVELNTSEVAIVIHQNATRRLKPELMIVLDEYKQSIETPRHIDLANQTPAEEGERWIARELLPGTYGISSDEYFI